MSVILVYGTLTHGLGAPTEILLDLWSRGIRGRLGSWIGEDTELELAITAIFEGRRLQVLLFWEEELQIACLALRRHGNVEIEDGRDAASGGAIVRCAVGLVWVL